MIERAVEAIRDIDSDVRIMYGGVCYNSVTNVKLLEQPKGDNIIFTFHCCDEAIPSYDEKIGCGILSVYNRYTF